MCNPFKIVVSFGKIFLCTAYTVHKLKPNKNPFILIYRTLARSLPPICGPCIFVEQRNSWQMAKMIFFFSSPKVYIHRHQQKKDEIFNFENLLPAQILHPFVCIFFFWQKNFSITAECLCCTVIKIIVMFFVALRNYPCKHITINLFQNNIAMSNCLYGR